MYRIYDLTCNDLRNPAGMDDEKPKFSWKLSSDRNNTYQISYRIKVFTQDKLCWDSGEILSGQTLSIPYQGTMLLTGSVYHWEVSSRNNHGEQAESETSVFLTGIMEADFWKASWIEAGEVRKPCTDITDPGPMFAGLLRSEEYPEKTLNPPVYLRREFLISKKVTKAVAFATARGIYSLELDGSEIGNLFAPEFTSYHRHLEYQCYDVTSYMCIGGHGLGCILADGWYTGKIGLMGIGNQYGDRNSFLMQLVISYEDGTEEVLCTDSLFSWNYGGYRYGDLFVGEYFDSGNEPYGFSKYGFDSSGWKKVSVSCDGVQGKLKGQSVPPIVRIRTIKPVLCQRSPKGEWILDAGEVVAGFTKFSLTAKKGDEIGLEHSEVLDHEGNFLQNIMGQNKNQKDRYLCGWDGIHEYEPKFTYHGFRYVKVTGVESVDPEDFRIVVVGSDLKKTGHFLTSNPLLNQLQENIFRSQQANMLAVPTDCPQRERAGWTGDMQVYAPTAVFNMDVKAFLERWLYDMRLEQLEDGQIPNVIPAIDSNKYIDGTDKTHICSAGWGDACVIVPYRLYQAYGDVSVLEENYQMMCGWMGYVGGKYEAKQWTTEFHFGDWLIPSIMKELHDPMQTAVRTKEVVSLAMYAYTTGLMAEICSTLGRQKEAETYILLNRNICREFSDTYVRDDGSLNQPLQGLYVLALQMNMVEERKIEGCVNHLLQLIQLNGGCLDTGFLSVPFLLDVLCRYDKHETAYSLLFNETAPSWLYEVRQGATTIWENWEAVRPDGERTNSSYNHFAFGCVGDVLYRRIGGLYATGAGYRKIEIRPDLSCGLSWAATEFDSAYGWIKIRWEKSGGGYKMDCQLPPGTSGVIRFGEENIEIGNGVFHYNFEINTAGFLCQFSGINRDFSGNDPNLS